MDKLTAFKVAFLSRCAEEGLDLDQIHQRVKEAVARAEASHEKKAVAPIGLLGGLGIGSALADPGIFGRGLRGLGGAITGFANSPSNTIGSDLAAGITGGTAGWYSDKILPLVLGGGALLAGGGLAAGKLMADSTDDPMAADEVKQQELVNEYKRLTDKTKRQTKFRQLKGN